MLIICDFVGFRKERVMVMLTVVVVVVVVVVGGEYEKEGVF